MRNLWNIYWRLCVKLELAWPTYEGRMAWRKAGNIAFNKWVNYG